MTAKTKKLKKKQNAGRIRYFQELESKLAEVRQKAPEERIKQKENERGCKAIGQERKRFGKIGQREGRKKTKEDTKTVQPPKERGHVALAQKSKVHKCQKRSGGCKNTAH